MTALQAEARVLLVDFTDPAMLSAWQPVHDAVMGGDSSGSLAATPGGAAFAGVVSLASGGGFASLRCGPRAWPTAGATALALTARGDGRRYQLTLRSEDRFDSIQYQGGFVAPAGWQRLTLPLGGFVASFRGRRPPDAPPLEAARIRTLGLLIAGGQAGPFRLELARLEAL
jgi:NADH dehydrogenase [ubiquinone] 1 alpha subcomplex assembly factor 1